MGDLDRSDNKTFGKCIDKVENNKVEVPIKKLHCVEGKHFIVISKSIAERLNFYDRDNAELYFQQEVTENDCIILRPFKMSE